MSSLIHKPTKIVLVGLFFSFMKIKITFLILVFIIGSCKKQEKTDYQYVSTKFKEYSSKIKKVEYNTQRIDTFPRGNSVWNNSGFAFIEKDKNDSIFGFSFYGKRNDIPKEYIYDKGNEFIISKVNKSYEIEAGSYGFIGSPGGQMVSRSVFYLDTIYKSVQLIENEKTYILKYKFEDDTIYNKTKITKTIVLKKDIFFPTKITKTFEQFGSKSVSLIILSDIKINEEVENSIKKYKYKIKNFNVIAQKKRQKNKILQNKIPSIYLSNLLNEKESFSLQTKKLTLISFWEVWCGPCIVSIPKLKELSNKFPNLQIIGIVTEDKESAIKLIEKKEVAFLNLIGDSKLKKAFNVNSWPRYFLIDLNGIVQKEYFGFSEEIEKDIIVYNKSEDLD